MPENEPFDPASLEEDAFLAGPERLADLEDDGDLLDVNPTFGKSFHQIWNDAMADTPDALIIAKDAVSTPAIAHDEYRFVNVAAGVLLLNAEGLPVGGYIGCDVAIDNDHQGIGLGAELILEYAMRWGSLPIWDHDTAGYSPAGEAAHRAAHRLARRRNLFAEKRGNLLKAENVPA